MSDPQALKPKVLVVDDTPANLVAMRRILAKLDCEVIEAGSGNEALAACLDNEFALILLDVQMPDMDGFEVATLLAGTAETQRTPIIFVTAAFRDDMDRMTAYEVGAVDYIAKPVNEFILLSKVKVFLELFRSRLALRTAESRARHQATHDALTSLPNRALLDDRLETGVARAAREQRRLALIYLDIDRFKPVNDRYGHRAGDLLLQAIADRLRARLRASDTVARIGGDEFAVILEPINGPDDAHRVCTQLSADIEQPFTLQLPDQPAPVQVMVGVSTGHAIYPLDGKTAEALLAAADARMYQMKHAARNS